MVPPIFISILLSSFYLLLSFFALEINFLYNYLNSCIYLPSISFFLLFTVTGLHDLDEYVQSQLLLAAMAIVTATLRPGGTFIAKIFRGKDISLLYSQLTAFFEDVAVAKPKSSRNSSVEAFVVCRKYAPPELFRPSALREVLQSIEAGYPEAQNSESLRKLVPFVACGDLGGWDADACYELPQSGYTPLPPVQPPTAPAYKTALERARAGGYPTLKS